MNHTISKQKILDMCGTVSFKKGDSFHRANKVTFDQSHSNSFVATVSGVEDFEVFVELDEQGGIHTTCSCPALPAFQKKCQHVAAVLLAISDTTPSSDKDLTNGFLSLFSEKTKRASRQQLHFENRELLSVVFRLSPVLVKKRVHMLGVEVIIKTHKVNNLRNFLCSVKEGATYKISHSFTYEPNHHCFTYETDLLLQQLNKISNDERLYTDIETTETKNEVLLLPPSFWELLIPLFKKAQNVELITTEQSYKFSVLNDRPPFEFFLTEADGLSYQLKIKGLQEGIVLPSYRLVIVEGRLFQVEEKDCERLTDLKQMLSSSGTDTITITTRQLDTFIETILPDLKRIGLVQIASNIRKKIQITPLRAKLYLDRVNNRLLAALEFHYGNVIINPFEKNISSTLIRDEEKENLILQLMEESSLSRTEAGYFLQNEELEYEFLYHVIPKLQKLVQLYATSAVRNRLSKVNPRPRIRVHFKRDRINWLEFTFVMDEIPEKHIREVLEALEEKRKYFRLRNGSLLSLETKEFDEIQRFLQSVPSQQEDIIEGIDVPLAHGLRLMEAVDNDQTFKRTDAFRQFLNELNNPNLLEFEIPFGFAHTLRDYQTDGFRWMRLLSSNGFGGILADDMGLGKTLQCITFIASQLSTIRNSKQPVLVVCPSSLTYNWKNEFLKFAPDIQTIVLDGSGTTRRKLQKTALHTDVIITSYPLLRMDIKWYEKQTFHGVIFDEAQAFKNPTSQTAKAVKKIKSDIRFALTGTPIENSLEELWSIFHVVFPELFMGLKEYNNLTKEKIARRIRPFLLRRRKEDVLLELPDKVKSLESVALLPDQKKLYAAYLAKLRNDTLKHLDKNTLHKNRIKILAGLTRLRQICCHPALFVDGYKGSSAKFEQLLQIVEESTLSGRRVLIFSQFTKMLSIISRTLVSRGIPYFYLDGQTPSEERVQICNRFNSGEREIFLISLKAGGTGLNLTGADTVILYDNWWNPAVEEQATDRAHRIGQTNVVQVIKLVASGTIEEKMNELQEKKRNLIEEIIDSKGTNSGNLTDEEIKEILMI